MSAIRHVIGLRIDPPIAQRHAHSLRSGLLLIAAVTFFAYVCAAHRLPFVGGGHAYSARALFAAADQVTPGTLVRVRGVDVGHVSSVRHDGNAALVTMQITDHGVHLKQDATATIRWRTLLGGQMAIDITPGSAAAATLGDRPIPIAHTSDQVEFDQLNDVYAGPTIQAQRTIFNQLPAALSPTPLRTAVNSLSPALAIIGSGVAPLRGQQADDLTSLVRSTARTLAGLGQDDRRLSDLVSAANQTFAATAAQATALGTWLNESPATLDVTRTTLTQLDHTITLLDPLADRLQPGARALAPAVLAARPAVASANALLTSARPLLHNLPAAMRSLRSAADYGRPLLSALDPTVLRLRDALLPYLARRDSDTGLRIYQSIGPTLSTLASSAGEFDSEGYWLHFPVEPGEHTVAPLPCQTYLTDPTATQKLRCDALNTVLVRLFGGTR